MGFDGGHWCGNAYEGPGGREYGRDVVKRGVATSEMAAEMVLAALPNLEGLSIGDSVGNLTRLADGKLNSTWPWTWRVEEYALEAFPL